MLRFPSFFFSSFPFLWFRFLAASFLRSTLVAGVAVGLFGDAVAELGICFAATVSKPAKTSATKIEADEISCWGNQDPKNQDSKNQEKCIATGHARVERDGMQTTAHQITAHQVINAQKKRQVTKILAQGQVQLVMKEGKATSDEAEFTAASETLELRGTLSKLMTTEDILTATQWIRYHRRDNWAEARGNVNCQTPQGTLYAGGVKAFFAQPSEGQIGGGKDVSHSSAQASSKKGEGPERGLSQGVKVKSLEAFRNVVVKTPKEFARGDYMRYDEDVGTLTIGKLPLSMTNSSSPSQTSERCQMLFTPDSSEQTPAPQGLNPKGLNPQGSKEMPDA